jgi:hypothetical protein
MINESLIAHDSERYDRPFPWTASVARPRQASTLRASGLLDHSWDEAKRRLEQRSAIEELLARAREPA